MGVHPDVLRERDAGLTWWRSSGTGIKIDRATVLKTRDNPEFSVALGAMEFRDGNHEFEFTITRNSEGYIYVGVAVPYISTEKTFCRRDANDQAWYYFGCGYTNALRNGWNDVISKEVAAPESKVAKIRSGDRVRALLDMDAGELKFAIVRGESGKCIDLPGKLLGIKGPVVAACCIQDRSDSVVLSDSARVNTRSVAPIVQTLIRKVDPAVPPNLAERISLLRKPRSASRLRHGTTLEAGEIYRREFYGGGGGGGGDIASRRRARRVQTSSAAVAGPRSLVVHQRARKPSRLPTTSRRAADRRSRRDRIQGSRPARRHIASRRRAPVPSARRVVAGAARRAVCRRRRRCPGELSARILALLLQERNCCSKPFSNSKNFLIENFNQKF